MMTQKTIAIKTAIPRAFISLLLREGEFEPPNKNLSNKFFTRLHRH